MNLDSERLPELILDIGCGNSPKGDVNVDLNFCKIRKDYNVVIKRAKNNPIVADAYCLPFRSGCFDLVYSRALLEHVKNPHRALMEMLRVSKRTVIFTIPHRYFRNGHWKIFHRVPPDHRIYGHFFNVRYVEEWLKQIEGVIFEIERLYEPQPTPTRLLPFFKFPSLIKVRLKKASI